MNLADLAPYFADEDKAFRFIERLMWPSGTICPHCGSKAKSYRLKGKATRRGLWKCKPCRKQFTVKVGTIFEGSHIELRKWLMVISMMCSSKKGVSANQIQRQIGVSYKSAWYVCHRIRLAMTQEPLKGKLGGIVEVDETYIGGERSKNPHSSYQPKPKLIVVGLIERDGRARTFPMPHARKGPVQALGHIPIKGIPNRAEM